MINMRKKAIFVISMILICSAVICFFALHKETETISLSWDSYKDDEELTKDSDLIALVKVDKVENTFVKDDLPYTTFSMHVLSPVWGTETDTAFLINMIGGEIDGRRVEVLDDPLMKPGEEYLVFCKKNTDGTYQILGGPHGRMVYMDERLTSLNLVYDRVDKANPKMMEVHDVLAESVLRGIKEYVEKYKK